MIQSFIKLKKHSIVLLFTLLLWNCSPGSSPVNSHKQQITDLPTITFIQSLNSVGVYDFNEIVIKVNNPFRKVRITGNFGLTGQHERLSVDGFCDSIDGNLFRIRFMPTEKGEYSYSVAYWQDNLQKYFTGKFNAINTNHRGLVAVDSNYPWHFIWKGTGEHYYLNGATAFLLMGWEDEKVIRDSLSCLHKLDVNRVRVLLNGRTDHFWTEPIKPNANFHAYLNPWVAKHPGDLTNPGFDLTRFNVTYWQKFERMLKYARDNDLIISVILDWNDSTTHPDAYKRKRVEWFLKSFFVVGNGEPSYLDKIPIFNKFIHKLQKIIYGWDDFSFRPATGSHDEQEYLRYASARLGAYSNITWDLGDDLDSFRDIIWTHDTGTVLYELDPYHHIITSHPRDKSCPQDRAANWFGMTSFQQWERPIHDWMLKQRKLQEGSGRIIPQVNEEYGYEDHYPA